MGNKYVKLNDKSFDQIDSFYDILSQYRYMTYYENKYVNTVNLENYESCINKLGEETCKYLWNLTKDYRSLLLMNLLLYSPFKKTDILQSFYCIEDTSVCFYNGENHIFFINSQSSIRENYEKITSKKLPIPK